MDSEQDRKRQSREEGEESERSQAGGKAKVDLHGLVDRSAPLLWHLSVLLPFLVVTERVVNRDVLSSFLQREYGQYPIITSIYLDLHHDLPLELPRGIWSLVKQPRLRNRRWFLSA